MTTSLRPLRIVPRDTDNERAADVFDLKLFNMMQTARGNADRVPGKAERLRWRTIANVLHGIRLTVRLMMSPRRIEETKDETA
jgi:hypothetical protein